MPRTVTLAELRTAVQQRGGVERSYDLTAAVLNGYVNSAAAELWDIIRKKGDDFLVTSSLLSSTAGSDEVPLPPTFYKLRVLWLADGSTPSGWRRLHSFTLDEAHLYGMTGGRDYRYRLQGSNLVLSSPTPTVETLKLYFVPYSPIMVTDGATLDGLSGYEELVICMAWRKCLVRQNLGTDGIDGEIARLMGRVSRDADGRDSEPFPLVRHRRRYRGDFANTDEDM